jgi:hypothetical protein
MDARLKTTEDPRPLTREECIVEAVLEIIGAAMVIEDGIERQIGPHDTHGVLYHLREACLATQRFRARQSKQAMRAIKQLGTALRRANRPKGGRGPVAAATHIGGQAASSKTYRCRDRERQRQAVPKICAVEQRAGCRSLDGGLTRRTSGLNRRLKGECHRCAGVSTGIYPARVRN